MSKRLLFTVLTFTAAVFLFFIAEYAVRFAPGVQLDKPNIPRLERKIVKELSRSKRIAIEFLHNTDSLRRAELFNIGVHYAESELNRRGVYFFVFDSDSLVFWSSKVDVSGVNPNSSSVQIQKIQSDYYFAQWVVSGSRSLLVLNRLSSEYPYQNKYLRNRFQSCYRGLDDYRVSLELAYNGMPVRANGVAHFYLVPVDSFKRSSIAGSKPLIQWLGFFALLVGIVMVFGSDFFRKRPLIKVLGFVGSIVLIRALCIYLGIPERAEGALFGPALFAHSAFNSSLGDFAINSVLVFLCARYIYRNGGVFSRIGHLYKKIFSGIVASGAIAMYVLVDGMYSSLVLHSTLTLETYRIFNVSIYSLIGYLSIALWVASTVLITLMWLRVFYASLRLRWMMFSAGVGVVIVAVGLGVIGHIPTAFGVGWMLATLCLLLYYANIRLEILNLRAYLILVAFLSAYSVAIVSHYSFKKEEDIRKVLAINLSSERDPVAEMLISPLCHKLLTDTLVRSYIRDVGRHNVDLYNHLRKNYFKNYLNRYELRATVCLPNSVMAIDGARSINCNQFFNSLIDRYGALIPSTRFFFLNLQNGAISYLGAIGYRYGDELRTLYIELDSRPNWELLGYPELLIEGKGTQPMLKQYSWAKYHRAMLITQAGDFPYKMRFAADDSVQSSFEMLNLQGFNHLIYHPNSEDSVILSRKQEEPLNVTASFAYNLLFFFVVLYILFKVAKCPVRLQPVNPSFKNRISWAISLIIVLSMVMVAAVTILYNINNFNQRNEKNLGEKLLSVMFELNKDIPLIYHTNTGSDVLTDRLIELSNIFYTDINIYDTAGNLMVTSRPEMFEKQLLGRRMNPVAWHEMAFKHSPKFVNNEHIGSLAFLSAYVPIVGPGNRTVAYLNLPYFTKQEELRGELYSIIVAIINIYALMVLFAIVVAVLISGQVTRPLELIRERISMVNIAGHNEPIHYSGNDEVGQLILEYNRMVGELAWSAKELARNQRESAWREMAKQIAHEVKNPLTPMKLSLQYLVKAKKDGVPDWDQRFEKFSESLVEQINSLTSIANEFSSFAKLPNANIGEVNLNKLVSDVVTLYQGYKNMDITLTNTLAFDPVVMADRDQLLRVFNNLVKNAIQSIERGKLGRIDVLIMPGDNDGSVKVHVSDNGIGIPDDVLSKLFTPNFTTKSGGSGLGLAITREIVHGFGGNIKVSTKVGEGSTFTVELPMGKASA